MGFSPHCFIISNSQVAVLALATSQVLLISHKSTAVGLSEPGLYLIPLQRATLPVTITANPF